MNSTCLQVPLGNTVIQNITLENTEHVCIFRNMYDVSVMTVCLILYFGDFVLYYVFRIVQVCWVLVGLCLGVEFSCCFWEICEYIKVQSKEINGANRKLKMKNNLVVEA